MLPEKKRKLYASQSDFYAEIVADLLDWTKLSKNGTLFDATMLESIF